MKKFFSLICLVVLLGFSANVMGQVSTGTAPYPGAKHTYTATANSGSTFAWTVTKDGLTAAATSTDMSILGEGTNVATIVWATTVSTSSTYYVRVVESNGGCINTRIMKVIPIVSKFNVAIAATTGGCYSAAPTVALNDGVIEYTHGTATVVYTVTPTNAQTNYKFNFAVSPVIGWTWGAPTVTGGSLSSSTVTVTGTAAVTLSFVVTKKNPTTNADDLDGTAADFSSSISVSSALTGTTYTIGNDGITPAAAVINVSRPHTATIVTD